MLRISEVCSSLTYVDSFGITLLSMGIFVAANPSLEFSDGKFNMPDEFEELERGVWETIFKGVSTALGDLKANIDTVQMSVNYP
ncbi:hypothetical protein GX48_06508 [Paracoccidioides brasiliensis]|nr:hypothetical protein GX48_06508 [Paracoccidioides brasiliensis]